MAIKDTAQGLLAFAQQQMDRIVKPETRQVAYERIQTFAKERPMFFTFVVAQALTSLLPVALFAAFASSVVTLSLGTALLFSLFWIGVALLLLIPSLFLAVAVGLVVFFWATGARMVWNTLPVALKNSLTSGRAREDGSEAENKQGNGSYRSSLSYAAATTRNRVSGLVNGQRDGNRTNGHGRTNGNGQANGQAKTAPQVEHNTPVRKLEDENVSQGHIFVTSDEETFEREKNMYS